MATCLNKKGELFMNNLSKVLLGIIIILVIALSFVTFKYLKLRDVVYENLGNYEFTNSRIGTKKLNNDICLFIYEYL